MITGSIKGNVLEIEGDEEINKIHHQNYYGKREDGKLVITPVEGLHLLDRELINVKEKDRRLEREDYVEKFLERDERFKLKYSVYKDLRDRGLVVKPGFKFGADFRVYPRGANPYKEGEKQQKDHTKFVVQAKHQDETIEFSQMSRAVRLASNIRAEMLWGVVDGERDVTYYKVSHTSP